MIITCPSCETSFSIEDGDLAGLRDPKFHCSKCEHIFHQELSAPNDDNDDITRTPAQEDESVAEQLSFLNSLEERIEDSRESVVNHAFHQEQAAALQESAVPTHTALGSDEQVEMLVTADWPTETAGQQRLVDFSSALVAPEHLRSEETTSLRPWQLSRLSLEQASETASWPESRLVAAGPDGLQQSIPAPSAHTLQIDDVSDSSISEGWAPYEHDADSSSTADEGELHVEFERFAEPASSDSLWNRARSQMLSREPLDADEIDASGPAFRSVIMQSIAIPAAITLILGVYAAISASGAIGLTYVFGGSTPRVPPAELQVAAVDTSEIMLDDGTSVLEVRGSVKNGSAHTFGEVSLVVDIFDSSGSLVREVRVPAQNKLHRVMSLEALPFETLHSMQRTPISNSQLSPKGQQPFRVVIDNAPETSERVRVRVASVHSL